jgi:hypothetical protein
MSAEELLSQKGNLMMGLEVMRWFKGGILQGQLNVRRLGTRPYAFVLKDAVRGIGCLLVSSSDGRMTEEL